MFLPTTKEEASLLGWQSLDIIIVTGDAYIDSPFIGTAVIGNYLVSHGFKVGIISQPDINTPADIRQLGEPALFWGVTAGAIDSMVSNYTPTKKYRKQDDLTPGGINIRRPDRASIAYTNLIRKHFKTTRPIVLGGIEASLRRIAHYDFWNDKIRRSVLFDAKADAIIYGMGEKAALELATKLQAAGDTVNTPEKTGTNAPLGALLSSIRGICYIAAEIPPHYIELPSFEKASTDKNEFTESFRAFYHNTDPLTARGLCQKHGDRYLVQNPPQPHLTTAELDEIYDLPYTRAHHPAYKNRGKVTALETINFSVTTHRGCYGECNFCAIAVHQGRTVTSRSEQSIIKEVQGITQLPGFTGYISDVGGPTANMYGIECEKKITIGDCGDKRCLFPAPCRMMPIDHRKQLNLLKKLRGIPGVKKVFVGSGIRYDMVLEDEKSGQEYVDAIVEHHVSGQMKIAPEHIVEPVLQAMGKPNTVPLKKFIALFKNANERFNKRQFMTYYFIAAHPGCTMNDMQRLKEFAQRELKMQPEQIQIFTPTPSTWSTVMYWTGVNPFTRQPVFVEKNPFRKEQQKTALK
ncbi:MAG: YgiQ family radical SAM protein [Elusimicrobia bacterium]|nr:YgiQ family radical SAM protein [Elusimicrobiota bacterium]